MAAISKTPSGSYRGVFTSQPIDSVVDAVNNLQGNGTAGLVTATPLTAVGETLSGTLSVMTTTIATAGASQGTATIITSRKVSITASTSSQGAKLPVWATGLEVDVLNVGISHKVKIYPNVNAKVSTGASNAADATLLAVMKNTIYKAVLTNTWIADRSA